MSESIYSTPRRRVLTWPASAPRLPAAEETASLTDHDDRLLAILGKPLAGQPAHVGFARKEGELIAAFVVLPILAQRALHLRLSNPLPGDPLATAFMRLTAERRTRLLTFLSDARRRAALAAGK